MMWQPRGAMCPESAHDGSVETMLALRAQLWPTLPTVATWGPDQQKRPRPESGAPSEPPKGIEPLTYSLRVNRSGRLS